MHARAFSSLMILGLLISGCIRFAIPTYYQKMEPSAESDTFRIWFDREGYILPDPALFDFDPADLKNAYGLVYSLKNISPEICIMQKKEDYEECHKKIIGTFARKIQAKIKGPHGTENRALFILIHGYANFYLEAHAKYAILKREILRQYKNQSPIFLELYWDGRVDPESPVLMGSRYLLHVITYWPTLARGTGHAWAYAVPSSKKVGLHGLRPLLSELIKGLVKTPKIFVITHSRGAGVISSALWNIDTKKPKRMSDEKFKELREISIPQDNGLHIGMIAPALGADELMKLELRRSASYPRIIFLINPRDKILNKSFGIFNWIFTANQFGSTAFGGEVDSHKRGIKYIVKHGTPKGNIKSLHPSLYPKEEQTDHDFRAYLDSPAFRKCFLPMLLDKESKPDLNSCVMIE